MFFPEQWKEFFEQEQKEQYFRELLIFLNKEYSTKEIFPSREKIFNAFSFFLPQETQVVILGQDPYHIPNVADGLAFSSSTSFRPKSLTNIFKEIERSLKIVSTDYNLSRWAKQGVLLLNTALTVERAKPLSHENKGWETFVLNAIKYLNEKAPDVVFLLMGEKAKKFIKTCDLKNYVVTTHPSPFSFHRGFYGSNCFVHVNEKLTEKKQKNIEW